MQCLRSWFWHPYLPHCMALWMPLSLVWTKRLCTSWGQQKSWSVSVGTIHCSHNLGKSPLLSLPWSVCCCHSLVDVFCCHCLGQHVVVIVFVRIHCCFGLVQCLSINVIVLVNVYICSLIQCPMSYFWSLSIVVTWLFPTVRVLLSAHCWHSFFGQHLLLL